MAEKTPIAPPTEVSPQTESFSFETPSVEPPEEPQEEQSSDDGYAFLWDDDEPEDENDERYQYVPSQKDFSRAWSNAKKATDPISAKVAIAESFSPRMKDDIQQRVEEESNIVSVEREQPESYLREGFAAAVAAGSAAGDVVSEYTPEPVKEGASYATDKVLSFGGKVVLPTVEYVDVPRSESWTKVYKNNARFLPDTGTWSGDALADVFSNVVSGVDTASRLFNEETEFEDEQSEEQYREDLDKLAKSIYSAFADGKLYKAAIEREGYFVKRPELYGLLEGSNATGEDLINIAFPIDVMQRLKANSPQSRADIEFGELRGFNPSRTAANLTNSTWWYDQLSSPVSRMGWGLAMEVVADPLWFVGPAKGASQAVYKGTSYNLNQSASRAAQILDNYSGASGRSGMHAQTVISSVIDSADDAARSRTVMKEAADLAEREARDNLVKAARLSRLADMTDDPASLQRAEAALRKELQKDVKAIEKLAQKYSGADGTPAVKAKYKTALEKVEQIKEDIAALQKFGGDADKAKEALLNMAEKRLANAAAHRGAASELRSFVGLAESSTHLPKIGITESSLVPVFGTWHIPFRTNTGTIATSSQLQAIGSKINKALEGQDQIITAVRKVSEASEKLSMSSINKKVADNLSQGTDTLSGLSNGEMLAWTMGQAFSKAKNISYRGADVLARMLGTRHWQALTASKAIQAEMAYYGSREGIMMGMSGSKEHIIRMKRLRPDLWENFQNSVTQYLNNFAGLSADATRRISILFNMAGGSDGKGGALAEWKAAVRDRDLPKLEAKLRSIDDEFDRLSALPKSPDVAQQLNALNRERSLVISDLQEKYKILNDDFGVQELLDEVADLIETGAGKLDETPWLKAVAKEWSSIEASLAKELGKDSEQVRQALVAMVRWGKGEKQAAEDLARRIAIINQVLEGTKPLIDPQKIAMDQIVDALNIRLTSKNQLFNVVSEKKLAEVIYRTVQVSRGRPFGQEVIQAIDDTLMEAFSGNREMVDEILDLASGIYATTPEEALLLFSRDVLGEYKLLKESLEAGKSPTLEWQKTLEGGLSGDDLVHPNWDPNHPVIGDIRPDMSLEEFTRYIEGQLVEHGAVFDGRNGRMVGAARGSKNQVDIKENIDVEVLEQLIQSGEIISIHNHPPGAWLSVITKINKDLKLFTKKQLEDVAKSLSESGAFSFPDLMSDIAMNSKMGIVATPNGTIWIVNRPEKGWPFAPGPYTTRWKDRVDAVLEMAGPFEQLTDDVLREIIDEIPNLLAYIKDDFATLKDALNRGVISKRQYAEIKKAKQKDALLFLMSYTREYYNEKAIKIFEEIFETKPFRVSIKNNKFSDRPPIRRDVGTGGIVVERDYTGRRIREAIRQEKFQTQGALTEIKNLRLGILGKEDLVYARELVESFGSKKFQDLENLTRNFVAKHYNISAPDEVVEQADLFLEDLISWVNTDYPVSNYGGAIFKNDQRISRSAAEWLDEKRKILDIPNTVTVDEVTDLLNKTISARQAAYAAQNKLDALKAGKKALKVKRSGESPLSKGVIRKRANEMQSERVQDVLDAAMKSSGSVEEVTAKIRSAFDELLDVPDDPIYARMKDEMAAKLADMTYRRKYSLKPALKESKKAGRKLLKSELAALKAELAEKAPRLEIPDVKPGESATVYLQDWEVRVWDEFKELTQNLTEEETLLSAYAALADSPRVINEKTIGKAAYDTFKERYKILSGRRMGELPEELRPVKDAFLSLIKHYENMYLEHGMTFVKSPVEMLKLWGVVDYVPHTPIPPREILANGLTESFLIKGGTQKYNQTLDRSFSTGMDQRKARLIRGTMREINAAANASGTMLGITPNTLLARYLKASKAISNQEFMYSLLAGKVLKPIKPKSPYDNALELIAKRRKLGLDEDIEKMDPQALDQLVRGSASQAELKILDDLLPTVGTGEMVPAAQRAADMNYSPIFKDASKSLSNDILINGNAADWAKANLIPNQMDEVIEEAANYSRLQREDKFAKFSRDTPIIRQADEIISVVASIRAKNYQDGKPLYNVLSRYQDELNTELNKMASLLKKRGKSSDEIAAALSKQKGAMEKNAWNAIAKELNGMASDLGLPVRVHGGEALRTFYNQTDEMWNLYIPNVVKQSIDDLFAPVGEKGAIYKGMKRLNDFWKIRVTIIAAAFHARNHLSNKFSNLLDTGVLSLDPKTAFDAGQLSSLVHFRDRFGSISAAKKALNAPRGRAESAWRYKKRQAEKALLDQLDSGDLSYDLGDGIFRDADEALKILEENGVIAGSLQQYVDVNLYETKLANIYNSAGLEKNLNKAKRFMSGVEDGVVMALPGLMTGMVLPIGLPKNLGSAIGRSVENQARLINFMSNVKLGRSYSAAAQQVNKFLFNYQDLTAVQKDWMRIVFPFFTWTQKNVALQLEMMQKNPVFYSQFQRLLIHGGPEVVERYNAEISGKPYIPERSSSKYSMAFRDDHARNYIRFPVPGKPGFYVEGLGLPQEALFDQLEMLSQTKNLFEPERLDKKQKGLRFLGQTHFLTKLMYESMLSKRNTFMDMPISEMTSGRFVGQVLGGVRQIPMAGPGMAGALEDVTGYTAHQYYNSRYGHFMDDIRVDGHANHLFQNLPWARVLKDAAAASMMYNASYLDRLDPELRTQYLQPDSMTPLSDTLKVLDAMTGIRLIAENKEARKARLDYDMKKRYEEAFKRAGITGQFPIEYIKEQ